MQQANFSRKTIEAKLTEGHSLFLEGKSKIVKNRPLRQCAKAYKIVLTGSAAGVWADKQGYSPDDEGMPACGLMKFSLVEWW